MPKLNITMKLDKINQIFEDEFNLFASKRQKNYEARVGLI